MIQHIWNNTKKFPFITLFIVLQVSVAVFIIFSTFYSYMNYKEISKAAETLYTDYTYNQFNPTTLEDETQMLLRDLLYTAQSDDKEFINRMENLYFDLQKINGLTVAFHFYEGNISVTGNKDKYISMILPEDIDIYLDTGLAHVVEYNGQTFLTLNTVVIDENFIDFFGMNISEGRGFEPNDFLYSDTDEIPVILGERFKKYFKVGDTIEISNITWTTLSDCTLRVIGFTEKNTAYIDRNGTYLISYDVQVIIPWRTDEYFEKNSHYSDDLTENIYYFGPTIKFSHYIIEKNKEEEVFDKIEETLNKYGIGEYFYISRPKTSTASIASNYREIFAVRLVVTGIILIFLFISLLCTTLNKINSNIKTYAIHMLTGSTHYSIATLCTFEAVVLYILGYIAGSSIYTTYNFFRYYNPLHQSQALKMGLILFVSFSVFALLCSMIFSYIKINSSDLSSLIRGKNSFKKNNFAIYKVLVTIILAVVGTGFTFITSIYNWSNNIELYHNNFFTKYAQLITVTTAPGTSEIPNIDYTVFDKGVSVRKWATISYTKNSPTILGVYFAEGAEMPQMLEGEFFPQDSRKNVAVVGRQVFEDFGSVKENGKKVAIINGIEYEVVGIMGKEEATTVDTLMFIPISVATNYFGKTGSFSIDGGSADAVETAVNAFTSQLEGFANNSTRKASLSALTSAPLDAIGMLLALLAVNAAVFSVYYIDKQKHIIAVKKQIGYSFFMILLDTISQFIMFTIIGFVGGNAIMYGLAKTVFKDITMFSFYKLNFENLAIAFAATAFLAIVFATIAITNTFKKDTSELIRG